MLQGQARLRTSARLIKGVEIKNSLKVNNLQERKKEIQEIAEHSKKQTSRKRKTNTEPIENTTKQDIEKNNIESKRSRTGNVNISDNDHKQKGTNSKKITRANLSTKSNESSKLFEENACSEHQEQAPNKQELSIQFNKRLDDLKKHYVFATTSIFETLCSRYESLRDESKAVAMSKYMRNKFPYFGISTPQRKSVSADLLKAAKELESNDLRTLALQTWYSPEREFQYFTVSLLEKEIYRIYEDNRLCTKDLAMKSLDFVKVFIEHPSSWWDTVDSLSPNVVGKLVQKYPDELLPEMDKWNVSPCFWVCRASILYQLSYKLNTDADRLFRYCLQAADEQEFFIRKAIGWALRQYFRTDPKAVRNFVLKHKDKLSPLSVKEALKHDK